MLECSSWHHPLLGVASAQETLMNVLGGSYQTALWFQIIWVLCHTVYSNSEVLKWDPLLQIMTVFTKEYAILGGYSRDLFDISLLFSALKYHENALESVQPYFTFFFNLQFKAEKLFPALLTIPLKPTMTS